MITQTTLRSDNAALLVALGGIRRQSNLLLLVSSFHKLEKYVQLQQQRIHLKRCAVLLKHQAVKKTVTVYFFCWLSITQRQTSKRSGQRELKKIVVLPRNQDFINLGIRYLAQWRLWLRRLRQRKQKNVVLLYTKTTERIHHYFFSQWRCFVLLQQKNRLKTNSYDIQDHHKQLSDYVVKLETELRQQHNIINKLNRNEQTLQAKNVEQQREIERLHELVRMACDKLGTSCTRNKAYVTCHTDENMVQRSDDMSLQLLTSCDNMANAIKRLRKTLPNEMASLEETEAILDAVLQRMEVLNDTSTEKQQMADKLHNIMGEALRLLEKPKMSSLQLDISAREGRKRAVGVRRTAEEIAQRGDDMPLRLLTSCDNMANAIKRLRKTLPNEMASLEETEAILDAVLQRIKALRDQVSRADQETATLRDSNKELRHLLDDLHAHDERWEPSNKFSAKVVVSHHTKQFNSSDWKLVLQRRPAELRRAFVLDAADACHVDPECITNVIMESDEPVVEFDVEHNSLVSVDEIVSRLEEYPFRAVRRVCLRRAAPKDGLDLMEEQLSEKEQELATLRTFMGQCVNTLESPGITSHKTELCCMAEMMAQRGDDIPLRLLTECEDVSNAIEKLRIVLPDNVVSLNSLKAILDAVFLHVGEVDKTITRFKNDLHSTKSVAVFLRDVVVEVTSRIILLANHASMAKGPLPHRKIKELSHPLLHWGLQGELCTLGKSVDEMEAVDVVRNHLDEYHGLTEKGISTANVLQSLDDAISLLHERVEKCVNLYNEEKETARQEQRRKDMLASAARDAIGVLQSWSIAPTGNAPESVDETQLAADVLRESEAASNAFTRLRELLTNDIPTHNGTFHGSLTESRSEKLSVSGPSSIMTHGDLVSAVQRLRDQLGEVNQAYDGIYREIFSHVPDFLLTGGTSSGSKCVTFQTPPASPQHDPVIKAQVIELALRSHIYGNKEEVTQLRDAIQRCIEALGAGDDDNDLETVDGSIEKSEAMGEKLTLLCRDIGSAIKDVCTAFGLPRGKKAKLSDMILILKSKMRELEVVKTETVAMLGEMCSSLSSDSQGHSNSLKRSLKPKRKPLVLSKRAEPEDIGLVKVALVDNSPSPSNLSTLGLDEVLQQLREEINRKNSEMRNLRGVCHMIVSLLNGSYMKNGEPLQYGDMLLPLLVAQSEELKSALQNIRATLTDESLNKNSVGGYLTMLASRLAAMHTKNVTLEEEVERRIRQASHLLSNLTEEDKRLTELNEGLQLRVRYLEDQMSARDRIRQLRAQTVMEVLRLRTVRTHLCKRFIVWLVQVSKGRCRAVRVATDEQKKLLTNIVQKQCQQNRLAKLLAIVLHMLPGATPQDLDSLSTENLLICSVQENEDASLETFVQERTRTAREWMQSLFSVVSVVASLRSDIMGLRQLITNAWDEKLRGAYYKMSTNAFVALAFSNKKKEREWEFIQNTAPERRALERENKELIDVVAKMQEQLARGQEYTVAQDEQIIKLRRENRDLQLRVVIHGNREDIYTPPATTTTASPSINQIGEDFAIISKAKQLTMEAIKAVAGKDLAGCIGEVAELTLEMYQRTTAALEDICSTQKTAPGLLPVVTEGRLQELQNLYSVRNEIVARLPKLFRTPFTE